MNKHTFSLFILSFILLISCNHKLESYPIEPHIVLKNIKISKESDQLGNQFELINITFDYTDGDSNLGRYPCDTSYNDYNCLATFYKKTNGKFNLIVDNNPIRILIGEVPKKANSSYIMPNMTIKARNPYEGEIQKAIYFYFNYPFTVGDTMKIAVQVIDNDNNKSNITELEKVYSYE